MKKGNVYEDLEQCVSAWSRGIGLGCQTSSCGAVLLPWLVLALHALLEGAYVTDFCFSILSSSLFLVFFLYIYLLLPFFVAVILVF